MIELHPTFSTPSPRFLSSPIRFLSPLKNFIVMTAVALLAGCASTSPPGMPGDPVLSTSPGTVPAVTPLYPRGALTPIDREQAGSGAVALLQPPADLWDRIRRGFAMPNLEGELVIDREQWYATRPD